MADIICKGSLILTLLAIVFVVYCCLIKGARQDEINQKVWDEYIGADGEDDDSVYSGDER